MNTNTLFITLYFAAIEFFGRQMVYCICANAEYLVNGQCCPMCAAGNRVYKHCTDDSSTTCVSCDTATFTPASNGVERCFSCSVCQTGLRIKIECTASSDTICEATDGFFCTEQNKGSCTLSVRHSQCKPGEYIQQRGAEFSDTVCDSCRNGTFSDGSLTECQPHSECVYGRQIQAGTLESDAVCASPVGFTVGMSVLAVVVFVVVVTTTKFVYCKRQT